MNFKAFLLYCLISWQSLVLGFQRDVNELAIEINKDHPHRGRRSADTLSFTIVYYDDISSAEKEEFETEFGEFVWKTIPKFNVAFLEVPQVMKDDLILDVRSKPCVKVVEHVVMRYETSTHAEMIDKNMFWNLDAVTHTENQRRQKKIVGTGAGTTIYILDSGIDDHVEFGSRINRVLSKSFRSEKDPFGDEEDTFDCRGHGTAVAGAAAGRTTGIASHATLISYAITECSSGAINPQSILEALAYLLEHFPSNGKVVINLSNGVNAVSDTDPSLIEAENKLSIKGAVIVRAAGNLGKDACKYGQKGLYDSFSVGSSDSSGDFASHSNHGECIDIVAPGVDLFLPVYGASGKAGSGLGSLTGTSYAAPMVSGAAAVIMGQHNIVGKDVLVSLKSNALAALSNLPVNTVNALLNLDTLPDFDILKAYIFNANSAIKPEYYTNYAITVNGNEVFNHSGSPPDCIKLCSGERYVISCHGFHFECTDPLGCTKRETQGLCHFFKTLTGYDKDNADMHDEKIGTNLFNLKTYDNTMGAYIQVNSRHEQSSFDCLLVAEYKNLSLSDCVFWLQDTGHPSYGMEFNNGTKVCRIFSCPKYFSFAAFDENEHATSLPGSTVLYHASKCAPTAISGYRLGADIEQLNQGFFETHENAYTCLGDLAIIKNAETVYECLDKAIFSQASHFNFELRSFSCELLSCSEPAKVIQRFGNWVRYEKQRYKFKREVTQSGATFRLMPVNRRRFLDTSCAHVQSFNFDYDFSYGAELTIFDAQDCASYAIGQEGNAFEMIPGGMLYQQRSFASQI